MWIETKMDQKELVRANKVALRYFCSSLNKSKKAKQYVLSRLPSDTVKDFYLGYAPKGIDLIEHLNARNVDEEEALHVGLIGLNDDGSAYEVFNNRLMFPIINNGIVVGFGGRTLGGSRTKYLNSKASLLYNKSEVLYLLDKAKKTIYEKKWALLVEGYFDVLSLYSYGIKNSVAVCGVAFRPFHAKLLKRWAKGVFVCFDGDKAGKKSAEKAKKLLKKEKIYAGTVTLPEDLDPDDYLKKYGKKEFMQSIKRS